MNLSIVLLLIVCLKEAQGNFTCGNLGISSESMVSSGNLNIPWTSFLVQESESSSTLPIPGTIVSPTLVVINANKFYDATLHQFKFKPNANYSVIVGSPELSRNTTRGQKIPVSFITVHYKFSRIQNWMDTQNDFALIHLASPIRLSKNVHPICVPNYGQYQLRLENGRLDPLFVYGWNRNNNTHYFGLQFTQLNNKDCSNMLSERKLPELEGRFCANVSKGNDNALCVNRDIGSFYTENRTSYFSGMVNNFYSNNGLCTKGAQYLIWSLTNETLNWIQNSNTCGPHSFTCFSDGECIPRQSLCNGINDCDDSSDEHEAYCKNPIVCTKEEFKCQLYGHCLAKSKVSDGISDCPDGEDEKGGETFNYLIIGLLTSLVVTGVTIGAVIYYRCRVQQLKKTIRDLTEEEVGEFLNGVVNKLNPNFQSSDSSKANTYINSNSCYVNYVDSAVLTKPWQQEYEIAFRNLQIGEELDRGNFGVVYKGTLKSDYVNLSQPNSDVAVKTQISSVGVAEFKNILRELKIMAHVGSHECIVGLIGACTENIRKRNMYIVIEYCNMGNLLKLLQNQDKDIFDNTKLFKENKLTQPEHQYVNDSFQLNTNDLLKWSCQIASGMAHLGSKNVIHGDLAARNVLLNSAYNAKVSDFGLSRELSDSNIYVKSTTEPIPWKWLALESFTTHTYSHKSDVWAYGVTLWEIFSLGEDPYGNIPCNMDFVIRLQSGERLPCPQFASADIYDILLKYWNDDSEKRPSFEYMQVMLGAIQNKTQ